jgi:hypothetical protein
MLHFNRLVGSGILVSLALAVLGCAEGSKTPGQGLVGASSSTKESQGTPRNVMLKRFEREGMMAKQKTGVWCWAACAEMVNNYYGRKMTQETIVSRIQGRAAADPEAAQMAKRQEVLAALDTDLFERLKEKDAKEKAWLRQKLLDPLHGLHLTLSTAKEFPREPKLKYDPDQLVDDLKHQHPVVLGLGVRTEDDSGHIVVIYGADAVEQERNFLDDLGDAVSGANPFAPKHPAKQPAKVKYTITKVYCADPDGGKMTEIPGSELERRADFLATRQGAEQYLQYLDKVDHYVSLHAR